MKKIPPILIPLALARLIGLGSASIWYDEAFSVFAARQPLFRMLELLSIDFTPPLWEMIIHPLAWGPLWLVRLPALLFSVGAAWLAWEIAGHKQPVLFTAMALLPGLLWHAQDARAYALLAFLYLLAAWFAIKGRWFGLTAACGLILYTHATGAAFVVGALVLALYHHSRSWKQILLCGFLSVLSFLPWVPGWLQNGTSGHWIPTMTLEWFLSQLSLSFWIGSTVSFTQLIFFIFLLFFSLVFAFIRIRYTLKTAILFVIPLVMMLAVSFTFHNVFIYRGLIPFVLPFAIWLVETIDGTKWLNRLLTPAWIALVVVSLVTWNPSARGASLEQAADTIEENWQDGDLIYYATGSVALPFAYYLPDKPTYIMGGEQHAGLGKPDILTGYGFEIADLDDLEYQRLWLIYPEDPLLTEDQASWLERIASNGQLIDKLVYSQCAHIHVVLVTK